MPRVPAIEASSDPGVVALIEDIRRERGGQLLLLYKVLLNSPAIAEGWLKMLTAVRQRTDLPGTLRELVILRIASLNRAAYEFASHVPHALKEGVSEVWIDRLRDGKLPEDLPEDMAAALNYTDEMTLSVTVERATFAAIARHFGDKQMLELTVTIAAYNMVSRVLVALCIDVEDIEGQTG